MNSTRIILLVENVHMGLGHDGLVSVSKKLRINPENLQEGELLMFLNRAKDKLKILGAQGRVIGYLKMPKGKRIMVDAIQYIPRTFGASGFNYDEALKQALEKRLGAGRRELHTSPLQAFRAKQGAGLTARNA